MLQTLETIATPGGQQFSMNGSGILVQLPVGNAVPRVSDTVESHSFLPFEVVQEGSAAAPAKIYCELVRFTYLNLENSCTYGL